MPNGQQYDLSTAVKDPDFIKAPIPDKLAFLSAHDSDFASASIQDKMGYLDHILGNDKFQAARANAPKTTGDVVRQSVTAPFTKDFWSQAGTAGKSLVGGMLNMPTSPAEAAIAGGKLGGQIGAEDVQRKAEGRSTPYRAVAGLGTAIGVPARQMEEQAEIGSVPGILGAAAPITAATVAGPSLFRKVGPAVDTVGDVNNVLAEKMRYPATARQSQLGRPGTIKPVLPSVLQRYTVPDWMIPTGDVGTPTNPGPFSEVPAKLPARLRGDPFNPTPKTTEPLQGRPSLFPAATSSAKPVGTAELPKTGGAPSLKPDVKIVSAFKTDETPTSRIIQPGTPEAKPQAVQGSYWSFDKGSLRNAVLLGDRDAAIIYKQRFGELPAGAGYLTDVAQAPTSGLYRGRE